MSAHSDDAEQIPLEEVKNSKNGAANATTQGTVVFNRSNGVCIEI